MSEMASGDSKDLVMGPNFYQNVTLKGNEIPRTIHGYEVKIHSSSASAISNVPAGSSKIKVSTITNQNWELPNHHGSLVANNNHYLAYILEGRNGYVLRLIQQETNNRALLKGFVGAIVDVAFAHANSNLMACLDQGGNLYIWDLDRAPDISKVQSESLRIQIQRSGTADSLEHRLSWCPYLPSEEEEGEEGLTIAVSHGNEVDVYDVGVVFSNIATGMTIPRTQLREGFFTVPNAHEMVIYDISLSPDGGVLATASKDGHLKFWEVNWKKVQPKCLHDFMPHKGAPITRLIFCDNHTTQDPTVQFWRFLITGANHNAEVKVWCTVTWKCLQTFTFYPPFNNPNEPPPHIKLSLDLTAAYLVATDTKRMVLYVLQLYQDGILGDASVTSITEYLLTQPILSFVVSGHTRLPPPEREGESDEGSGEEEDAWIARKFDSRRNSVLIKVHCVQTRSMQELLVRFEPPDLLGVPPEEHVFPPVPPTEDGHTEVPNESEAVPEDTETEPAVLSPTSSSANETTPDVTIVTSSSGSLNPLTGEKSSLASKMVSSGITPLFASLPILAGHLTSSTTPIKLITPSDFTSPAKSEAAPLRETPPTTMPFSLSVTTPPLQEPTIQEESLVSDTTLTSISELKSLALSSELSTEADISDLSGLKDPESERVFELPVHPLQAFEYQQEGLSVGEGLNLGGEGLNPVGLGGEGLMPVGGEELKSQLVEGEELELQGDKEEERPEPRDSNDESPEDANLEEHEVVQKSLNSIFDLLQIDNPYRPPAGGDEPGFNQQGYEEFKQILSDPEKQKQMLTSAEKSTFVDEKSEFVSHTSNDHVQIDNEGSERVNTGGPPADYLELFKQKTPPIDTAENLPEHSTSESPWPDIGGPDFPEGFPQAPPEGLPEEFPQAPPEGLPEGFPQAPPEGLQEGFPQAPPEGSDVTEIERQQERLMTIEKAVGEVSDLSVSATVLQEEQPSGSETAVITTQGAEITRPLSSDQTEPVSPEASAAPITLESFIPPLEARGDLLGDQEDVILRETPEANALQPIDSMPPLQVPVESLLTPEAASKSQKKRRRSKSKKQSTELFEIPVSHDSDGEPNSEVQLGPAEQNDSTLLSELYQLVARQQQEMAQMREEQQRNFVLLQQQLESIGTTTLTEHKASLTEHSRDQQQRMDKILRDKQTLDKQRQDRLISSVSQTLTTAVNTKLDKLVRNEMKGQVVPAVNRSMSSLQDQMAASMNQKLATTNTALHEGITQILQSKGFPEAIGNAVARALQRTIQNTYEEVFRTAVLPSFEKACQEMFRQVDEAFRRGTTEYMAQLQQQFHQLQEPSLQQLTATVHSLHSLLTSEGSPFYTNIQSCLQQEMRTMMQHTQQVVADTVTSAVQNEVDSAIQRHAEKLNPEARLQEERKRKEEEVMKRLQSQEINSAFELALSTSDLPLVMFLCQQVSPEVVFDKDPCPLTQPVLLSLIQQLSVDLKEHLELKIRYLEQSILALDMNDDVTKSHMPPVLSGLSQHLSGVEKSLQTNPGATGLMRQVKRLRMVSERMCQPQGR